MKRSTIRTEIVSALNFDKQFVDKVCMVTGATSGIGKSVAKKLIKAGIFIKIHFQRRHCYYDWKDNAKT